MKESDNTKIDISRNFILSLSLLIMKPECSLPHSQEPDVQTVTGVLCTEGLDFQYMTTLSINSMQTLVYTKINLKSASPCIITQFK
jgi:hypothetical protein